MRITRNSLVLAAAVLPAFAGIGLPGPAAAETEIVTVTGDRVRLIATSPDDTAFGFSKPLLETPRAVTSVSDVTAGRYGVDGVDDLTAITPSAYTASFYGVEGAVNLRGTLAESYFRGFKRAENRGTFDTALSDAADIDILRGPPSALYGAGKVGGLVNIVPKSGDTGDEVALTYGSYSKRDLAAAAGKAFMLGEVKGSVHAYGELDDSFSYYRGLHPTHQMLQLSGALAWSGWSLTADYMYSHANGEVQTPGWNRLTQALIDNGTYITGRDTSLKDADGNGRLTPDELGGNPYTFDPGFKPLTLAVPFCGTCTDAAHSLDSGIGLTHLSRRQVYIAPGIDFSNTITHTGFAELARNLDGGDVLRLQGFVDTLANDRFVSYGFPASYRTRIEEIRLRYDFARDSFDGHLTSNNIFGASWRMVHALAKESFNSGMIALDRRDISAGPAPNDIIDSPFNEVSPGTIGLGWENDVHSDISDAGLFALSDLAWDDGLDVTLGARYDAYDVRSTDKGVLAYEPVSGRDGKASFTWSASLAYKNSSGFVPYLTHAHSAAVEIGQASQVPTALLAADDWLSSSFLDEVGVKAALLDNHLTGAVAWYRQARTQLIQATVASVMGTDSEGGELEIRYVVTDHLSFTFAGSLQHTIVKGPDHSFAYLPAREAGVSPLAGFGGAYVTYDFSSLRPGNYEYSLIPHAVLSPYLTYTEENWGATFGGTYVSATAQTVPDPIRFPAYVTLNASAFVRLSDWTVAANVNNLAAARYFTPDADTYANLGALPGVGRTWRITVKRTF
jgi:iron complex outermembrane receptor protein